METVLGILGIIGLLVFVSIILPSVFAKLFNSNIGHRGGVIASPDDIDNWKDAVKKKVDSKYALKKRIEEEYRNEVKPIQSKISSIHFRMSQEGISLREKSLSDIEVEKLLDNKYSGILIPLYKQEVEIKGKYEKIAGYPMPKT